MDWFKTSLGRLRVIGWWEGLSFLLLLGIAMPLKYWFGRPEYVRVLGMAHGALFLLYVAANIIFQSDSRVWATIKTAALMIGTGAIYLALRAICKRMEKRLSPHEAYASALRQPLRSGFPHSILRSLRRQAGANVTC